MKNIYHLHYNYTEILRYLSLLLSDAKDRENYGNVFDPEKIKSFSVLHPEFFNVSVQAIYTPTKIN